MTTTFNKAVEAAVEAYCNAIWAKDGEGWNNADDKQQAEFRLGCAAALKAAFAVVREDPTMARSTARYFDALTGEQP